jgi:hypothetical protein
MTLIALPEHKVTGVKRGEYIYFTCPRLPKAEFQSHGMPKRCPVCKIMYPIKQALLLAAPIVEGSPLKALAENKYSQYVGSEIEYTR